MKQVLLGSVFSVAVACAPTLAADLSYPVKAPPKVAAVPAFSWNGFYLGANIGGAWGDIRSFSAKYTDPDGFEFDDRWNTKASGFFGGGQIGFNHQFATNFLIGLEFDIQGSTFGARSSVITQIFDGDTFDIEGERGTEVKWFATMRGRLGFTHDRLLVYATGGAAVGKVVMFANNYSFDGSEPRNISHSSVNWGWTAGAGLEWAFRGPWSLKTEYLYVDLGTVEANPFVSNGFGDYETRSDRVKFHTFKVGLNYRFP